MGVRIVNLVGNSNSFHIEFPHFFKGQLHEAHCNAHLFFANFQKKKFYKKNSLIIHSFLSKNSFFFLYKIRMILLKKNPCNLRVTMMGVFPLYMTHMSTQK